MNKIFKLKPAISPKVWGGTRLANEFYKAEPGTQIGETWEISAHADGEAIIENGELAGKTLAAVVKENPEVMGTYPNEIGYFPILTKFIDAKSALSIQVHPDDEYAHKNEGDNGKTEMWYIIGAEEGSFIYLGPKETLNEAEAREKLKDGTFAELLRPFEVQPGDCFYVPSGTIHAIGAGVLVYEIQQSSNITYRLFDYNRPGSDGKPRELHVEQSFAVMDLDPVDLKNVSLAKDRKSGEEKLFYGKHFQTDLITVDGERNLEVGDESFLGLTIIEGEAKASRGNEEVELKLGETIFVPAGSDSVLLSGNCRAIISRVQPSESDV